jgi:hypothetical protein
MRNRYGFEYEFERISENAYTIVGNILDTNYWRMGGEEDNLVFIDPPGGPFIDIGYEISEGVQVKKISFQEDRWILEV